MYTTVIFDLDGTLMDTLEDLTDSVNFALDQCGFPVRTIQEIRQFVGNGILNLITRAVPDHTAKEDMMRCFEMFREYYGTHCNIKTRAYDGIMELLCELKKQGIKMAIVSNKTDPAVKKLNAEYFSDYIHVAIGENEAGDIRKKPAPDTVLMALKELESTVEESIYVGDSEVDRETAKQCGMDIISVTWGFRDKELLESLQPNFIIDKPIQILECIR